MKRTDRRSDCPINFALQTFGDSWSLLIIRDLMFGGARTYREFEAGPEGISTSVLADRLRTLTDNGIIRREGRGRSTRYSLTQAGLDLLPLLLEMMLWSAEHDSEIPELKGFMKRIQADRAGVQAEIEARVRETHGL